MLCVEWGFFGCLLSTLVLAIPNAGELVGPFCALFSALHCFGFCNAVVVAPRELTALWNID